MGGAARDRFPFLSQTWKQQDPQVWALFRSLVRRYNVFKIYVSINTSQINQTHLLTVCTKRTRCLSSGYVTPASALVTALARLM